jgi:ribosomal protein S1
MNFGVIVNIGDITGIVPSREFRIRKISTRNFVTGDPIKVKYLDLKEDKITFELDAPIKKFDTKEKEE